ncbi:nitrogenase-stabilizing/protective protein NifW [Pseudaquabacterium rugosum]|uniref:Nitrogenase-stabilizing/protective protein NifW n=1 Tax=Pseudaquabacterium rugosum TaxID=2984194 RepID=A0ABU9BCW5_9BURK
MDESLTQRLRRLSSAEDFLVFFGVPFDEKTVHVNRLHILKRFYQYLHKTEGLAGLDDVELFRRYRELLIQAHSDFVRSTPAQEKVFKVFQDAEGTQSVSLTSLRDSLAERRQQRGGDAPQMVAQAPRPPQAG